jgi:N-acetylneuraminate synthase
MKTIKTLRDLNIGTEFAPFIIAEMSGNHNGSLERALAIVDATTEAGAQALKLQTYTADTMTLNLRNEEFVDHNPKSLWYGTSLYELYQKAYTPWEWHERIFDRCRERGLIGFSSPFDATAVDFLETLDVPLYKVASFELIDLPLIRKIAKTGKPMIMSTGMASEQEIHEAISAAREGGCRDIVILKCTSAYPAQATESNLNTLKYMKDRFKVEVGLSDHTLGLGASIASVALGACVIERHVTLSRAEEGVDSKFSLEPSELGSLVSETRAAHEALGQVYFGPTASEKSSFGFRRSLYIVKDIKPGDTFTPENIRAIRPGRGLPPKHFDDIMGKKANQIIKRGTPVSWELIEK